MSVLDVVQSLPISRTVKVAVANFSTSNPMYNAYDIGIFDRAGVRAFTIGTGRFNTNDSLVLTWDTASVPDGNYTIQYYFSFLVWELKSSISVVVKNKDLVANPPLVAASYPALYRTFGRNSHFYTSSFSEYTSVVSSGFRDEGIACRVWNDAGSGERIALYRLFYGGKNLHFYTANTAELQACLQGGWTYEGIVGYVYLSQFEGTVPLYRSNNLSSGDHFYTTSWLEMNAATANGWSYEGVACFVGTQ